MSDVRNQSLAIGVDRTFSTRCWRTSASGGSSTRSTSCRSTSARTPAADAGIPGLNFDDTFSSGLPAGFVDGDDCDRAGAFEFGSGLGVNRCNCPLDQDEKQFQFVGNLTKFFGNHTFKFGIDVRRAYNLRVPSDAHRSGELTFNSDRTWPSRAAAWGSRRFLLGDVTTSAVRQPEHGCARAPVAPLLLRAGHVARKRQADAQLRAAAGRHQPADDQRARQ